MIGRGFVDHEAPARYQKHTPTTRLKKKHFFVHFF
jgi:hypothetical protein